MAASSGIAVQFYYNINIIDVSFLASDGRAALDGNIIKRRAFGNMFLEYKSEFFV